jgi:hypothetical protein
MTNLVALTLAVVIAMTGNFQAGLESMQQEAYEQAIGHFTQIVEAEAPASQLYWPALYYRAQAHAALDAREAALADTVALLFSDADPLIKRQAQTLYTAQGGDLKALRPKLSAKQYMEQTIAALARDEQGEARKRIKGPLSEALRVMGTYMAAHGMHAAQHGGFLSHLAAAQPVIGEERFDDTNRTATVTISMHQDMMQVRLGLENRNREWVVTDLKDVVFKLDRVRHADFEHMHGDRPVATAVERFEGEVDETLSLEVPGLMKDLGAAQASVRAAARRRLVEIKDKVRPSLEAFANDPDPEIQMTVRELLR